MYCINPFAHYSEGTAMPAAKKLAAHTGDALGRIC